MLLKILVIFIISLNLLPFAYASCRVISCTIKLCSKSWVLYRQYQQYQLISPRLNGRVEAEFIYNFGIAIFWVMRFIGSYKFLYLTNDLFFISGIQIDTYYYINNFTGVLLLMGLTFFSINLQKGKQFETLDIKHLFK